MRWSERYLPAIVAAWCASAALFLGVAFAQNPIPDSVTTKALDGLESGGFKGMFWVAAIVAAVFGLALSWLVKKFVDNLQATAAVALEQAKADQKTGDRLTSIENFLRAKGMP